MWRNLSKVLCGRYRSTRRTSLRLESLEGRLTPATFTVTTTDDVVSVVDGKLSLREAITRANERPRADVIVVPAGIYKIALGALGDDANAGGDFDITGSLTVRGAGAERTVIDAQQMDRVFDIQGNYESPVKVAFQGMTIRNGMAAGEGGADVNGGGVRFTNAGLVVRDCVVTGNRAIGAGGGISNDGAPHPADSATLLRTKVYLNIAGEEGGGVYVFGVLKVRDCSIRRNVSDADGGGLSASSSVLVNSQVDGNTAAGLGGGVSGHWVTLTNSTVNGNATDSSGGGIAAFIKLTVIGCTVSGNTAQIGAGGITAGEAVLTNSTIDGNAAGADGGGIVGVTLTLKGCTVNGNTAGARGGGIYGGTATLISSTVTDNTAASTGGGISADTVTLTRSTINDNSAVSDGGGIRAITANLTGCTVSGNLSGNHGGGIHVVTATLTDCSINGNTARSNDSGFVYGRGGGIFAEEELALSRSIVSGNTANLFGGGIQARKATVTKCIIQSNRTVNIFGSGGGMYVFSEAKVSDSTVSDNSSEWYGGGIEAESVTLTNSVLRGNRTQGLGGGISANRATLTNCTLSGNTARSYGGGIFVDFDATLIDCTVSGNSSGFQGGGIHAESAVLTNCNINGNSSYLEGGGIKATRSATLTNCSLNSNTAGTFGGGLDVTYGTGYLTDCTVSGNRAANGGGINAGNLTLRSSTVSDNRAAFDGGGLAANDAYLLNSTISSNTAGDQGGGVWAIAATVHNCTVVENVAADGGGIFNEGVETIIIRNTIVANNIAISSDPDGSGDPDVSGAFVSGGNNLIGVDTRSIFIHGVNGDLVGTSLDPIDPMLGALAFNGGPTKTHRLLAGSLAIDAGNNDSVPATDQRGVARIRDGNGDGIRIVDIGAFER